mmetsp:Transcript_112668/g.318319  ORF Transcript_112668/g.318319 Transcript_112668/m.318319 type:complete len:349 (+) Transcript_112668:1109-2155(+)
MEGHKVCHLRWRVVWQAHRSGGACLESGMGLAERIAAFQDERDGYSKAQRRYASDRQCHCQAGTGLRHELPTRLARPSHQQWPFTRRKPMHSLCVRHRREEEVLSHPWRRKQPAHAGKELVVAGPIVKHNSAVDAGHPRVAALEVSELPAAIHANRPKLNAPSALFIDNGRHAEFVDADVEVCHAQGFRFIDCRVTGEAHDGSVRVCDGRLRRVDIVVGPALSQRAKRQGVRVVNVQATRCGAHERHKQSRGQESAMRHTKNHQRRDDKSPDHHEDKDWHLVVGEGEKNGHHEDHEEEHNARNAEVDVHITGCVLQLRADATERVIPYLSRGSCRSWSLRSRRRHGLH